MKRKILLAILSTATLLSLTFAISACGSKDAEHEKSDLPAHEHTYATTWSTNDSVHWHAATCEHEGKRKDPEAHAYDEDYVCTVCKYEHKHTFSNKLVSDFTTCWYPATCGHDVTRYRVPHGFKNGVCTACGFVDAGLMYELNKDGESYAAYVGRYTKGDVVIPDTYEGKPVTRIKSDGFLNREVTSVVIPDSVTVIEDSAFYGCAMKSVVIPSSVTSIEREAFSGCDKLESVVIPDSITRIERLTFFECSALERVVIPDSVTVIEDFAFGQCTNLKDISIPDGVTFIGQAAFEGCTSLKKIVIPSKLTSIEAYAFEGCSSLTNIVIPKGITSIKKRAFYGCNGLTEIQIPSGVTLIEPAAFAGCGSVVRIEVAKENARYHSDENCIIETATNTLIAGCKTSVIPSYVTVIGASAFEELLTLTSIVIPEGVVTIGEEAFHDCTNLASIVIPESLTLIKENAFLFCTALKSIYYKGTAQQWDLIEIKRDFLGRGDIYKATRYYYSETRPTEEMWASEDNYWHYGANMVPAVWVKDE